MPKRTKLKKFNWKRLPDPLTENQVNLEVTWTADERTTAALERQAKKLGRDSVIQYVRSNVVTWLLTDEDDTVVTDDGRIVGGWETMGKDGFPKNI
jgi:hypothetical protein